MQEPQATQNYPVSGCGILQDATVSFGMHIGKRIRIARQLAELTQESLGEIVGRTGTSISRIESGESEPGIDLLRKIAVALKVSVASLLNESGGVAGAPQSTDVPEQQGETMQAKFNKLQEENSRLREEVQSLKSLLGDQLLEHVIRQLRHKET